MRLLRLSLLLLVVVCCSFRNNDQPDLHVLRRQLMAAIESSKVTDSLYNKLSGIRDKQPIIQAYIGTLRALKAKHTWNPYYKIKYISDAEKDYQAAVAADPHNMEIRFMRFSVEHNVPGFLGYNKNLTADRLEIIHQLNNRTGEEDKDLVVAVIKFLIGSKRCTPAETASLHKQLAQLT